MEMGGKTDTKTGRSEIKIKENRAVSVNTQAPTITAHKSALTLT